MHHDPSRTQHAHTLLPEPSPKRGANRWPYIAAGFLVAHATLMCICVTIAVRNHAASGVIPRYYEKAVTWDQHHGDPALMQELDPALPEEEQHARQESERP